MPELVYDVKFRIDPASAQQVSQVAGGGGVAGSGRDVQRTTGLVNALGEAYENVGTTATKAGNQASGALAQVGNQAKRSQKDVNRFTDGLNKTGRAASRTHKNFSVANQTIFSFSDGIQDATQFSQGFGVGMRAIGNNIGFTIELFTSLQNRVKEYNAVAIAFNKANADAIALGQKQAMGMMTTLGALKASFLGPGGVLLAVNALVSIMTVLGTRTKQADSEMSRFAETVKSLRDAARLDFGIASQLDQEVVDIQSAISLLEGLEARRTQLFSEVSIGGDQSVLVQKREIKKLLEEEEEAVMELVKSYGFETTSLEELEERLESVNKAREIFTKNVAGQEVALQSFVDTLVGDVSKSLLKFELGIKDSDVALSLQQTRVKETVDLYKSFVDAGDDSYLPFLKQLTDLYKELTDATKDSNKEQEEQIELIKQTPLIALEIARLQRFISTNEFGISRSRAERLRDLRKEYATLTIEDQVDLQIALLEIDNEYTDYFKEGVRSRAQASLESAQQRQYAELALQRTLIEIENDGLDELEKLRDHDLKVLFQQYVDGKIETYQDYRNAQLLIDKEYHKNREKLEKDGSKSSLSIEVMTQRTRDQIIKNAVSGFSSLAQAAFNNSKEVAIATTIIETYVAAQMAYKQALAVPGVGIPLAKLAAASAIASGLARVLAIRNTEIGSSSVSDKGGGGASFGFQMNQVEGPQTFRTPEFMPTGGMGKESQTTKVEIMADRKQLYYLVKTGEEEYRQRQA